MGIPGSGLSYVTASGSRRRATKSSAGSADLAATPRAAPRPGLFAAKGEKVLHKLIESDSTHVEQFDATAGQYPDQWLAASTLAAMRRVESGQTDDGTVGQLRHVFEYPVRPEADAFIGRYLPGASATIRIAPGVTAELPLSRDLIGLALAEALQAREQIDAAIDVVERLEPTSHAAVSLAELYCEVGRYEDVVDLTNAVHNEDDVTALLLVYRGIAWHQQGLYEAAREAFKEALRSKKRAVDIRHLALRHRAETYVADGRKAQARKDLERILAEDASIDGVRQRLDELTS